MECFDLLRKLRSPPKFAAIEPQRNQQGKVQMVSQRGPRRLQEDGMKV